MKIWSTFIKFLENLGICQKRVIESEFSPEVETQEKTEPSLPEPMVLPVTVSETATVTNITPITASSYVVVDLKENVDDGIAWWVSEPEPEPIAKPKKARKAASKPKKKVATPKAKTKKAPKSQVSDPSVKKKTKRTWGK